jgi:hypothetical protein
MTWNAPIYLLHYATFRGFCGKDLVFICLLGRSLNFHSRDHLARRRRGLLRPTTLAQESLLGVFLRPPLGFHSKGGTLDQHRSSSCRICKSAQAAAGLPAVGISDFDYLPFPSFSFQSSTFSSSGLSFSSFQVASKQDLRVQ